MLVVSDAEQWMLVKNDDIKDKTCQWWDAVQHMLVVSDWVWEAVSEYSVSASGAKQNEIPVGRLCYTWQLSFLYKVADAPIEEHLASVKRKGRKPWW